MTDVTIESVLKEDRLFAPDPDLAREAQVKSLAEYEALFARAEVNPEGFWAEQAEALTWARRWERVLDWKLPHARWFVGGALNLSVNCLDRHLTTWRRNKAAIIWEGEPGDAAVLTFNDLHRETCKFANALTRLGARTGDRVAIYMPMIPEAAIAMLACARIGAVHTVVFGGFSAEALADRINDAGARLVITADGGWRRGSIVPLKENVDLALLKCPAVEKVVVARRTRQRVAMEPGRDLWWEDVTADASHKHVAPALDSEHPLFILYTSGTTGKPKGVLHTTAGYLLGASLTHRWVFDHKDTDTYWCTADIGWVTGHSYVLYGPLANGATTVMYEGAPNYPEPDRYWQIVDKHRVSVFYTAPTAIRSFMKWGDRWTLKHELDSLRLLGTVGEPINPEAWIWYQRTIGRGRCPIVDTWWQTETGAIMISPLPGATPTKPGSCTRPFPGVQAQVVRRDGTPCAPNEGGYLVIKQPWPSMMRTIYGDDARYREEYWSQIPGCYFAGDGARRDAQGYFWVMGRVDDVINTSGHRLGTMEVESALVSHALVAEAAVVGRPDEIKGQAIVAFVTLEDGREASAELRRELADHVAAEIGSMARPDDIRFTRSLPKTRSGKIMRRLLREIAAGGQVLGDVTTLEDLTVLERLRAGDED